MQRDYPKSIKEHHELVRGLRCVVTDRPRVSLHHVQGSSVGRRLAEMGYDPLKSLNQRGSGSEALVIPLAPELHFAGADAIDGQMGRTTWETRFGKQSDFVDEVSAQVGYDLWKLFVLWSSVKHVKIVV